MIGRSMSSNIVPFNFNDRQVRVVMIDDEPWFVAADICRVLEVGNPSQALTRLDEDEVTLISNEGRNSNVVSESGLYSLILGSRKPEAKVFKRWITHEVIPEIRKTGSYGVQFQIPKTYAAALELAALQARELEQLEAKAKADAPKVLFADSVSTASTTVLVGDLAKILRGNGVDIGANRLFAWLRDNGFLIKRQGTDWNMPTQRSMDLGLFKVKETAVTHSDGHVTISKTSKVTGKGQAYFIEKFLDPNEMEAVA
jgi:anti-repressor protein